MKAIIGERYGSPDTLDLREVPTPAVAADRVLLRVRAASVNASDYRVLRGKPLLARPLMGGTLRPKEHRRGADVAGVVEAVGADVTTLKAGDEVFGAGLGSFAEYVAPLADRLVPKPPNLTFEEAAAIPIAAITALQALRDKGGLQAGQRVLVNGAGGGVGTFLVQLARALGAAHITAVCGPHNVEIVRSLGPDRVVDYSREDFTKLGEEYDLIAENAGGTSIRRLLSLLTPHGTLVVVGSHTNPLGHLASAAIQGRLGSKKAVGFIAKLNHEDLVQLGELAAAGTIRPVIDRTYPLAETAEAYRYTERMHSLGKVVVTV
jgi:NADPH:quinone reductase-like Zn-dependent oxidoreductase